MPGKRKFPKYLEEEISKNHKKKLETKEKIMELEAEKYVKGIDFTKDGKWDNHLRKQSNDLEDIAEQEDTESIIMSIDRQASNSYNRDIGFKTSYVLSPINKENKIENIERSKFSEETYGIAKDIRLTRRFNLVTGAITLDYMGELSSFDLRKLETLAKKNNYKILQVTKVKLSGLSYDQENGQ